MAKYRKKPVVIEAIQFDSGDRWEEIKAFVGDRVEKFDATAISITTLEGPMLASFGDYIIKGVKGEFYPCKPDIFEMTYDAVD